MENSVEKWELNDEVSDEAEHGCMKLYWINMF